MGDVSEKPIVFFGAGGTLRQQDARIFAIYIYPRGSMYGIFTYIWVIFMVNVGKYTIHGSYGYTQNMLYYLLP